MDRRSGRQKTERTPQTQRVTVELGATNDRLLRGHHRRHTPSVSAHWGCALVANRLGLEVVHPHF